MPFIITIKDTKLGIEEKNFVTKLSINTLKIEKGIGIANIIEMFNTSISDAEDRLNASITLEAEVRLTEDQALAVIITNLETTFNESQSAINTSLTSIATETQALSIITTSLEASVSGIGARLDTTEYVMAGYFTFWDGIANPLIGQLKVEAGITYQYTGGNTWRRYDEGALGVANQVKGWVAGASSLVVDPTTKNVTGWQYGDGSGFDSFFKISADNIELSGTTTFSSYALTSYVDSEVGLALSAAQSALSAAQNAQTTADSKIVTFYQSSEPLTASEGDIWFDTNEGNKVYTYSNSLWVTAQDTKIADAINYAQTAQTTADGKAVVYYQIDSPTGLTTSDKGDIWIDTNDNNKMYIWNSSSWILAQDYYTALSAAQSAYNLADSKATLLQVQALGYVLPTGVADAVNNNTTTINGSKITTGTIATLQLAAYAVTADKIAAEAITADKIKAGEVTASKLAVMGLSTFTNDVGYTSFKTFMQTTQPTAASIGDLWIDTDDNNKTYRYNGATWDTTTFDAAVAINTGTTTISGAKITTGSITADKINTTGLIAENISSTTITGKTITGSTINASTVNLGDLNVVNSAGYATYGVFYANWVVSATYASNVHTCTFTSDLYTFNSTNTSKYRLKNNTNGRLFFDFPYPTVSSLVGTVMTQQICYTSGALSSISVSVYVGSTLFASKTTGWTQNVWYELGGIGFMYYYVSASDQRLFMRLDNPAITAAGTAADALIKIITSANLGGATDTYLNSGILCRTFISNL